MQRIRSLRKTTSKRRVSHIGSTVSSFDEDISSNGRDQDSGKNKNDESYDFQDETKDHQQLFRKRKHFSYIVLFIYIGYIISFILENRSGDLEDMNNTLEPLIKDRLNIHTTHSKKPFDSVISMGDAYYYVLDRLHFIYLNLEPSANREFIRSILHSYPETHYNYVHLNFIQSFSILEGALLTIESEDNRSYKKFFKATLNQTEFYTELLSFTKQLVGGFKPVDLTRLALLKFEFIYYNLNNEVSIYYKFQFDLNLRKGFHKYFEKRMFLPRFNDSTSKYYTEQIIVWVIRVVYLLYFIWFVVTFFLGDMRIQIKKSIALRKMLIDWYTFVYILYIIVNTNYFFMYYRLLASNGLYDGKPIDSESRFQTWISMSETQKEVYKYNGFLTIFLIIRLMDLIQVKFFESLRIVFYSFAVTSDLLITFFLAVGIFLIAFLVYSNLVLVEYERSFTDFYKTFEIVALSIFQDYNFPRSSLTAYLSSNATAPVFFFVLFIFFNTFALQFFIAIIVSSYRELRLRYQNALEALGELEKRQGSRLSQKIVSFLTFRSYSKYDWKVNKTAEDDQQEEHHPQINKKTRKDTVNSDSQISSEESGNELRKKEVEVQKYKGKQKRMKEIRPREREETKPIWQIVSHNWQAFKIFESRGDEDFVSRDNRLNTLRRIKNKIKNKRLADIEQQSNELKTERVSNFAKFLFYLIYIFLFATCVSRHLNMSSRFLVYTSISEDISRTTFQTPFALNLTNFYDISTLNDYSAWVENYTQSFLDISLKGLFKAIANYNYHLSPLIGSYFYAKKSLTDIIVKVKNKTNISNATVVHYLNDKKVSLFDWNEDDQIQKRNRFYEKTNTHLNYSKAQEAIEFMISVKSMDNNNLRYFNTTEFITLFRSIQIADVDIVKCGMENIFINLNRKLITNVQYLIYIDKSGGIRPKVSINTIITRPYDIGFISYLAEIVWVTIFLNYVYGVFKMFMEIYYKPKLRALTECDEEFKNKDVFTRLMNHPIEKVESLTEGISRVMQHLLRHLDRIFQTFGEFFAYKTLYTFHLISILISIIAMAIWIKIAFLSYSDNLNVDYMLSSKSGDDERDIFLLISQIARYFMLYRKIQGINAIFIVCGIFAYFSFSLKMSIVLHVVQLAKRDLFSYAIIFLTIVFGFGIGGYMIYGDKLENFNSVLRSSLEIILMTIGGVNYEIMKAAEPLVTPVFVFTYLIAAYIIFLKMFIVILDATYNDLINHVESEDIALLSYINTLLEEITNQITIYTEGMSREELDKRFKERHGLFSRINYRFQIFYHSVFKNLQAHLWKTMITILQFKNKNSIYNRSGDRKLAQDVASIYSGIRYYDSNSRITASMGDRFSTMKSFRTYTNMFILHEGTIKGNKMGYSEEDTNGMNQWFNSVNNYIEASTNKKYSLNKNRQGYSAGQKKEILFNLLNISTLLTFRENNLIDPNFSLKDVCRTLKSKVTPSSFKTKSKKAFIHDKISQSQISSSRLGGVQDDIGIDEHPVAEEFNDEQQANPKYALLGNVLKLMLFEFYAKKIKQGKNTKQDRVRSDSVYSSKLHDESFLNQLIYKKLNLENLDKMVEEINLFDVLVEFHESKLDWEYLYELWIEVPKETRNKFWALDHKDYMTINQKFFYFYSMKFTFTYKKNFFIFPDAQTMLTFLIIGKSLKFNCEDPVLTKVFQITNSIGSQQDLRYKQVKFLSINSIKAAEKYNEIDFMLELIGIDFFRKIAVLKHQSERMKISQKHELIKGIEIIQMWFTLKLEDRLSLLMLVEDQYFFNFLCSTITGEIIFGDFVYSIHSLSFLNDHMNRQMFDLYLLNSQNKAGSLNIEKRSQAKGEEFSKEQYVEYKRRFIDPTKEQLKSKIAKYKIKVDDIMKSDKKIALQIIRKAANRYCDLRGLGTISMGELLKNEKDEVALNKAIKGLGEFLKQKYIEIPKNNPAKSRAITKKITKPPLNLRFKNDQPLETEERGLLSDEIIDVSPVNARIVFPNNLDRNNKSKNGLFDSIGYLKE